MEEEDVEGVEAEVVAGEGAFAFAEAGPAVVLLEELVEVAVAPFAAP